MDDSYKAVIELKRDEYVAAVFNIDSQTLAQFPYRLDEKTSDDGHVYGWRIHWKQSAPPGVFTEQYAGSLWSDIDVIGPEEKLFASHS